MTPFIDCLERTKTIQNSTVSKESPNNNLISHITTLLCVKYIQAEIII